jgi:hypothetical protein
LVLEVAKHIDKNRCGEMFPHATSLGDFSVRKYAETYPLFNSGIYTISDHREEDVCDETYWHRQFLAQRSKLLKKKSGALKSPVCVLKLWPRSLLKSEFLERWQDKRVPPYGEEIKAEQKKYGEMAGRVARYRKDKTSAKRFMKCINGTTFLPDHLSSAVRRAGGWVGGRAGVWPRFNG